MTPSQAIRIMLGLLFALIFFYSFILVGIIPYEYTWGGRLESRSDMIVMETFSLALNGLLILLLLGRGSYVKPWLSRQVTNILLWVYLVLFAFNTLGNLLAETLFEKFFTILTLTFTVMLWMIVRQKSPNQTD